MANVLYDFVSGATITPYVGDGDLSRRHRREGSAGSDAGRRRNQQTGRVEIVIQ
jgi:hypothetical protein